MLGEVDTAVAVARRSWRARRASTAARFARRSEPLHDGSASECSAGSVSTPTGTSRIARLKKAAAGATMAPAAARHWRKISISHWLCSFLGSPRSDVAWRTRASIDLGRALPASERGGSNGGACKRARSTRGISEHSPLNAWRAGAHALVRALVRPCEICSRPREDDARAPHDARKPQRARLKSRAHDGWPIVIFVWTRSEKRYNAAWVRARAQRPHAASARARQLFAPRCSPGRN